MANPMITFTERLKSTINPPDNHSASKNIELISQYFDDRISENEAGKCILFFTFKSDTAGSKLTHAFLVRIIIIIIIELAVERMFATETPSVLGFVKLVLLQCKAFKDEITQAFELMLKVIELHPAIVKKYVKAIVEVGRPSFDTI